MPFTHEQFIDVFAAYNEDFWAVALVLWLLSAVAIGFVLTRRELHRWVTTLLAVHWAWVGVAYHGIHFSAINPAAPAFALGFLIQAVLLAAVAWRRPPRYEWRRDSRQVWGAALALYGLLYPLVAAAIVGTYPRIPAFGVPCPLTLYTIGVLLLAVRLRPWLFLIPLLWTIIGGSAAVLLRIAPDFILMVAGIVVLSYIVALHVRRQRAV